MKASTRRTFVKDAVMLGAVAPLLAEARPVASFSDLREPVRPELQAQTLYTEGSGNIPASVLTDEQQAKLEVAAGRLKAQLPLLHSSPLPYDLEPAFVFRPRMATRPARKL